MYCWNVDLIAMMSLSQPSRGRCNIRQCEKSSSFRVHRWFQKTWNACDWSPAVKFEQGLNDKKRKTPLLCFLMFASILTDSNCDISHNVSWNGAFCILFSWNKLQKNMWFYWISAKQPLYMSDSVTSVYCYSNTMLPLWYIVTLIIILSFYGFVLLHLGMCQFQLYLTFRVNKFQLLFKLLFALGSSETAPP